MRLSKMQWEELKVIILIILKYVSLGIVYVWSTRVLVMSLSNFLVRNHIEYVDQFTLGIWLLVISYIVYAIGTPFYLLYNCLIRMSYVNFAIFKQQHGTHDDS